MTINPFHFGREDISSYPFVTVRPRIRALVHSFFWIVSFLLLVFLVRIFKTTDEAIIRSSATLFCIMTIFYGSRIFIKRYYEKKLYLKWLTFTAIMILIMATFRLLIDLKVLHSTTFRQGNTDDVSAGRKIALFIFLTTTGIIITTLCSLYHITKNRVALEKHYFKLKLQHVEAQLNFLKAQVNPHFLFNTLNNIYAATELRNPNAPSMILQLSQLLRYITYTVKQKKICLAEEWEQVENYIQLFCSKDPAISYPIELKAEGDLDKVKIPPMILLPLVENAVKYSDIHEQAGDANMIIHLSCNVTQMQFHIINTYSENANQPDSDGGVGNQNILERLQLEYPGQFTLQTEKDSRFFTAFLTIQL